MKSSQTTMEEKIEEILNQFDNVLTEVNPRDTEYSIIAKKYAGKLLTLFQKELEKERERI